MKSFLILIVVFIFSGPAMAQLQVQTLGAESLANAKSITVGNNNVGSGVKVKVLNQFVGEPAAFPFRLRTYIKCSGTKSYKVMNLAKYIIDNYPTNFSSMVGAPTAKFPQGVLQTCFFENVNFDSKKLFLTVFEPGSNHCDRSQVLTLMFPLQEFCGK